MRFLTLLLITACSVDSAEAPDAGIAMDATPPDTGPVDSGVELDAGPAPLPQGWAPLADTPNAEGRWGARMVYVESQNRFVLFGGTQYPSGNTVGDMWAFDIEQNAWTELTTAGAVPPPRYCHCMALLPDDRVLLVGGRGDFGPLAASAWILDLATLEWTLIAGSVPTGVIGCAAEWMPTIQRVIVVGGGSRSGFDRRTWSFDPTIDTFEIVQTSSTPPVRSDPDSAYDPVNGRMLVFGGVVRAQPPFEHRDDLWAFDGAEWTQIASDPHPSHRRFAATAVLDDRWLLFSGTADSEDRADLWAFDLRTDAWTSLDMAGAPEARGFSASGTDGRALYLFGGFTQPFVAAKTDGWRYVP